MLCLSGENEMGEPKKRKEKENAKRKNLAVSVLLPAGFFSGELLSYATVLEPGQLWN